MNAQFKNIVGKVNYSEIEARGFGFKLDKDLEPSTARYFIGAEFLKLPNFKGCIYSAGVRKETGNTRILPHFFDLWGQWRCTYCGLKCWGDPMLEIIFDKSPEA